MGLVLYQGQLLMNEIKIILRLAQEGDFHDLLRWRNAKHVRASMINQKKISAKQHNKWWKSTVTDTGTRLLVLEIDHKPVAVINFFNLDLDKRFGWWGFYLTELCNRRNTLEIWTYVESITLRYAFDFLGLKRLFCETRRENIPVLLLHERFCFETVSSEISSKAIENDLIVKQITAEKFYKNKAQLLSSDILNAQMPIKKEKPRSNTSEAANLAIIGSANWEEIAHELSKAFLDFGALRVECIVPKFGQGFIELTDPSSNLRLENPDYLILAERFEDFVPALETLTDDMICTAEHRLNDYIENIRHVRSTMTGHFFVHDLCITKPFLSSFREDVTEDGATAKCIAKMNTKLAKLCEELPDTTLLPISKIVKEIGTIDANPGKYWLMGRFPFGPKFRGYYHKLLVGGIMALEGLTARALVLDLDNTLWGGVVGDDGKFGVQIGSDYPGNQFVSFQSFIKSLINQGLILTVCSKNCEEVALSVFNDNPNMIIKVRDLTSHRINWSTKSQNIKEISREIDLGLSSLMFIDDNPMEREEVRQNCPGVIVPEMPNDVTQWPGFLARHPALTTIEISQNDRDKVDKYRIRAQIKDVERVSVDRHSFLRNLEMSIEIKPLIEANKPRALQILTKTNQFNTTSKRFSEAELDEKLAKGNDVLTVRIKDRFGSDEIIAVLVITYTEDLNAHIDNFVMSCRVMGRGTETAILADVCKRAIDRGCRRLVGKIINTERNQPCRNVYSDHDFEMHSSKVFILELEKPTQFPDWFKYL